MSRGRSKVEERRIPALELEGKALELYKQAWALEPSFELYAGRNLDSGAPYARWIADLGDSWLQGSIGGCDVAKLEELLTNATAALRYEKQNRGGHLEPVEAAVSSGA